MNNLNLINDLLNDKLLIERSRELTHKLFNAGMKIDMVCFCVKDYQKKYIFMKERNAEKIYDIDMWLIVSYDKEKGVLKQLV